MTKNDIIRKLTSRKLWVAIAAFVSGLIVALDGDAETAETVSGLILQGAAVVAYIVAEGLADSAHVGEVATVEIETEQTDETHKIGFE